MAIGIDTQGRRPVLGVSVSLSEAEVHRREFLASLHARGLHGVKLVNSDSHAGLKEALAARLSRVQWQLCQLHLAEDAMAFVPKPSMRRQLAASLRAVFDARDRAEAERQLGMSVKKYLTSAPKLAEWLESAIPDGLMVFALPSAAADGQHAGAAQRGDPAADPGGSLFPNEASALQLVNAVLMEISEVWEAGRKCLTVGPD